MPRICGGLLSELALITIVRSLGLLSSKVTGRSSAEMAEALLRSHSLKLIYIEDSAEALEEAQWEVGSRGVDRSPLASSHGFSKSL